MRIVILGMGYGGLKLALDLERGQRKGQTEAELVLIDQFPFHQLITELHQVAAGSIAYDAVTIPYQRLLENRRVKFLQTSVTGFDFVGRTVETDHGPVEYDRLVIALGGAVDFFESATSWIPGLRDHAWVVQSVQHAHRAVEALHEKLFRFKDQRQPGEKFHCAIGGGGLTGVELAGQLADELQALCAKQGLPRDCVEVHLVEAGHRLVPGLHPKIAKYVTRVLERKGVVIHLYDPVVKVSDQDIVLGSGKSLPYRWLLWAGGVKGHPLLVNRGLPVDGKGRLVVNGYLQVRDAPRDDNVATVYAIGDCAYFLDPETGRPLPPMARAAIDQAEWLARYLVGQERFPYIPTFRGAVISIGRNAAVAVIGNLRFFGRLAALLKTLVSIKYLLAIGGPRLVAHQLRIGTLGKI